MERNVPAPKYIKRHFPLISVAGIDGFFPPGQVSPALLYARFNVLETSRLKLQLPDRRAIIEDEFLKSFLRKVDSGAVSNRTTTRISQSVCPRWVLWIFELSAEKVRRSREKNQHSCKAARITGGDRCTVASMTAYILARSHSAWPAQRRPAKNSAFELGTGEHLPLDENLVVPPIQASVTCCFLSENPSQE